MEFDCEAWKAVAVGWEVLAKYGDVTWNAPEYRCTEQVVGSGQASGQFPFNSPDLPREAAPPAARARNYVRGASIEEGTLAYETCLQGRTTWSGGDPFTPHQEFGGGLSAGAIAGIVIACIVFVAILALVVIAFVKKMWCFKGGDSSASIKS
jgi:hypothetical protein